MSLGCIAFHSLINHRRNQQRFPAVLRTDWIKIKIGSLNWLNQHKDWVVNARLSSKCNIFRWVSSHQPNNRSALLALVLEYNLRQLWLIASTPPTSDNTFWCLLPCGSIQWPGGGGVVLWLEISDKGHFARGVPFLFPHLAASMNNCVFRESF